MPPSRRSPHRWHKRGNDRCEIRSDGSRQWIKDPSGMEKVGSRKQWPFISSMLTHLYPNRYEIGRISEMMTSFEEHHPGNIPASSPLSHLREPNSRTPLLLSPSSANEWDDGSEVMMGLYQRGDRWQWMVCPGCTVLMLARMNGSWALWSELFACVYYCTVQS